jgi:hypothetical protein
MVDHSHSSPTSQWQDKQRQGKRPCLPGSFGNANSQMQMTSTITLQPSNAALEPLGFVESSISFSGLHEISGLLWRNDSSGASPLNSQLSPDSWADCFPQPAANFPASSSTVNSFKELWTLAGSPETLERLPGCLEIDSMSYPGRSMSGDPVRYPEDHQTSLTPLNLPAISSWGLPTPSTPWDQHNNLGNEMPLRPVSPSGIASLSSPTGMTSWSQPNQLNTQIPWLQLYSTGVDSLDSFDIPKGNVLRNQDCPLNSNLLQDATIRTDDSSTESETSRALLLQAKQLDPLGGNFALSSISDRCSQTSYECSQNEAPENATTILLDDSKYPSRAESPFSTQFEKSTMGNGLSEDYSSFQQHVARNQEALGNAWPERSEEIHEVGYDTCFGMVGSQ